MRLLKTKVQKTKTIEPANTGVNRKLHSARLITPTKATAPPGGWRVFVSCMTLIAVATAKAITQGSEPNKCTIIKLTNPPRKLPTIQLRGCARGLSGAANNKTAAAQKGAAIRG